ncbi:MAG: glycosyltransferase family A protein [Acidocella sp.]|nr:glycosyltransferase family A protein [Acidocella sp.]
MEFPDAAPPPSHRVTGIAAMMFSVVIPLFNKAPHIAAAINSVLAQTLSPDEIIVVDDGSTDASAALAESFAGQQVMLIRQANQGVSAARNTGVAAARSSHVAFLDADDIWLPRHLETLQSLILQFPDAQLYSTLYEIHLGSNVFWPKSAYSYGFVGMVDDFFRRMAIGLSLVNSTTACVTRQAFFEVGGFPTNVKRGEDVVLWMKLSQKFTVAHSATITAVYNRNAVNRSASLREQTAPGSLLYLQKFMALPAASHLASAKLLFRQIAFYAAAGMREAGDFDGLTAIRRLAQQNNMPSLALNIYLIGFVPPAVLSLARRFRHKSQ